MHLLVPDRQEAARWYQKNLGFEVVGEYAAWAELEGGPLHIPLAATHFRSLG